jgi:hypothetical protein
MDFSFKFLNRIQLGLVVVLLLKQQQSREPLLLAPVRFMALAGGATAFCLSHHVATLL